MPTRPAHARPWALDRNTGWQAVRAATATGESGRGRAQQAETLVAARRAADTLAAVARARAEAAMEAAETLAAARGAAARRAAPYLRCCLLWHLPPLIAAGCGTQSRPKSLEVS